MRVYLSGQKHFGLLVFEMLSGLPDVELVGVASPAWRDERLPLFAEYHSNRVDRLRGAAERDGVPWLEASQLCADRLPKGVDLLIAAHSHAFVGKLTRQKLRIGAIGFHPSLLPLHRGRDAVRWAVKMRERVTGGSVYWLNDSVDAGPLAAQDWCHIHPDDTPETLWRRELQPMGVRLLGSVLNDLRRGVMVMVEQDEALATWEPSWGREPLYRPDLPRLGSGVDGMTVLPFFSSRVSIPVNVG